MEYIVYKGNKYKKTTEGYYLRTERLHRRIWEDANGEIPPKHHIHHKDGNKSNNSLENLECISEKDHPHQHFDWEKQVQLLHRARDEANKWHKSRGGRKWHSENSRLAYARRKPIEKVCVVCGVSFLTKNLTGTKYCGQKCRSRAAKLGLMTPRKVKNNDSISSIK